MSEQAPDLPTEDQSSPPKSEYFRGLELRVKNPNGVLEKGWYYQSEYVGDDGQLYVTVDKRTGDDVPPGERLVRDIPYNELASWQNETDTPSQEALTKEQQKARTMAIEYLKPLLQKALDQQKLLASKDKRYADNYLPVKRLEALIQQAHTGNLEEKVTVNGINDRGKLWVESISLDEFFGKRVIDDGDQKAEPVFDAIGEALHSTATPLAEEEAGEEQDDKSSSNENSTDNKEKVLPKSKFQIGDKVRVQVMGSFSDGEVVDLEERDTRSGKQIFASVKVGEGAEKKLLPIPEWMLARWNSQHTKDRNAQSKPRKNGNDKDSNDNQKNEESPEPENYWLDPRKIHELKSIFQDNLEKARAEPKPEMADEVAANYDNILKTRVLKRIIDEEIEAKTKKINGKYGWADAHPDTDFFVPEEPSEQIKGQMLHLLDESSEEVESKMLNKERYKFEIGQSVQFASLGGKVEGGWKVAGYPRSISGDVIVKIVNDKGEERWPFQDVLLRMQTLEAGQEDDLEKLNKFIKDPKAKVKVGDHIVNGEFRGYSTSSHTDEKVYVADENGNQLPGKVKVEDFLSWQHEKTEAEKDQEVIEEYKRKLAPYMDQEIKLRNEEGDKWISGYKCVDFLEKDKAVKVVGPQGDEHLIRVENFLKLQEQAAKEEEEAAKKAEQERERESSTPPAPAETPAPVAASEDKQEEKRPLSWWEQMNEPFNKLPSYKKKVPATIGWLVFTATPIGLATGVAQIVQHKWLKYSWKKEQENKAKMEQEERERQERKAREERQRSESRGTPEPAVATP
jgi:hypothetical protein